MPGKKGKVQHSSWPRKTSIVLYYQSQLKRCFQAQNQDQFFLLTRVVLKALKFYLISFWWFLGFCNTLITLKSSLSNNNQNGNMQKLVTRSVIAANTKFFGSFWNVLLARFTRAERKLTSSQSKCYSNSCSSAAKCLSSDNFYHFL